MVSTAQIIALLRLGCRMHVQPQPGEDDRVSTFRWVCFDVCASGTLCEHVDAHRCFAMLDEIGKAMGFVLRDKQRGLNRIGPQYSASGVKHFTCTGLRMSGAVWARYGDARGVNTWEIGATRWRERHRDPGRSRREALAADPLDPQTP